MNHMSTMNISGFGGCQCQHCIDEEYDLNYVSDDYYESDDYDSDYEAEVSKTNDEKKSSLTVLEPPKLDADQQKKQAELFNKQQEETQKDQKMRALIYKILGPSKREREEAAIKEKRSKYTKPQADAKFYTWKKGARANKTSHTAWGHRRNGGGKHKVQTLSQMNSEKAAAELAAARALRRKTNKEKAQIEQQKLVEVMKRIESQTKEVVKEQPKVVEETEYQKFKRKELDEFNNDHRKKMKIEPVIESVVEEKKPIKIKVVTDNKWEVVDKQAKKKEILAKKITKAFYEKPKKPATFEKKPMGKSNRKTMLCKSVLFGTKCPYPHGKCNFAHTSQELHPRACMNHRCKFVRCSNGVFTNNGHKKCMFLHEGESKSNFFNRVTQKKK
jgi:hypothetical protein